MKKYTSPLDYVDVAAPCPADWNEMIGNDVKRFCGQCELNVHNLSGMTREEAEALIVNTEGRLCVRFYRRADGTILTNNCPVGLRALKRRVSRIKNATLSAALGFLSGLGFYAALEEQQPPTTMMGEMRVTEQTVKPQDSGFIMGAPAMPVQEESLEQGQLLMGRVIPARDNQHPNSKHWKK